MTILGEDTRVFRVGDKRFRLTFREWKQKVNYFIERKAMIGADDLPDWDYYSAWASEVCPKEAADSVLRAACEDMGMDYEQVFG